jgi:hypothetical protein
MGGNRRYESRAPAPPAPTRRIRHVWIAPSAQYGDMTPWPGLVVQWQKRDDGWWALVAMVTIDGSLVVKWRHGRFIRPATTSVDGR